MMTLRKLMLAILGVLLLSGAGYALTQSFSVEERAIGTTQNTWAFMTAWNLSNGDLQFSRDWYNGTETWTFNQPYYRNWIAKFIYNKSAGQTRELQWSYTQEQIQYPVPAQVTVSGRITNVVTGAGVDGVTVSFSAGGGTATTSGGGHYSRSVNSGWSGTITPSFDNGGFVPASRSLNNVTANTGNQNFGWQYDYLVVDLAAGPSASSYPVSYLASVPPGGWTDEHKTTKLVFRRIPAGTYTMGSPTNELGRYSVEVQHQVTISQPFYIGVFEVTQKQWERVMGNYPSWFTNVTHRDSRPVERVSYHTIRGTNNWPTSALVGTNTFMGLLRARTGLAFDLPTEAQWEYAGRAGTVTALNSGFNLTNTSSDARMAEVGRYFYNHPGGYSSSRNATTAGGTAKAGSYLPNAWGLYDIHGNVWEWSLDWYGTYPGTVTDPLGPTSGSDRMFRGCSWDSFADRGRSARRADIAPDDAFSDVGFRVALPPGQ